ncbi:MAG: DinB family protein [Thermomicrobiales bacterium]|nr:DinB family protein [Thermomicrobiales bacterium]
MELDEILDRLRNAPLQMAIIGIDATPKQLRAAPAPDEWSAVDILAHLRACADVWGSCIEQLLSEDHPTIRAVSPRRWIKQTNYRELEFHLSLDAFIRQRSNLMNIVEPLPPEAYARAATITGAGRPIERTVRSFAQRLVVHERPHIRQMARAANVRL